MSFEKPFGLLLLFLCITLLFKLNRSQKFINNNEALIESFVAVILVLLFSTTVKYTYDILQTDNTKSMWEVFLWISNIFIVVYVGVITYLTFQRRMGNSIKYELTYMQNDNLKKLKLYNFKDKPAMVMGIYLRKKVNIGKIFSLKCKNKVFTFCLYNQVRYIQICKPSKLPIQIKPFEEYSIYIDSKINREDLKQNKYVFVLSTIDGMYLMHSRLSIWMPTKEQMIN